MSNKGPTIINNGQKRGKSYYYSDTRYWSNVEIAGIVVDPLYQVGGTLVAIKDFGAKFHKCQHDKGE